MKWQVKRQVPGVDASDPLILQDGEQSMEAGFVLSSLRALTAQLHPVLHQVQWLHKDCRTHPGDTDRYRKRDTDRDRQTGTDRETDEKSYSSKHQQQKNINNPGETDG